MNVVADSFASTPAGYITGIFVPAMLLIIGWFFRRGEKRRAQEQSRLWRKLTALESALTVNTQALALIVQRASVDQKTLEIVPTLDKAVAVLQDRLDRHEEWANNENNRLRGEL